MLDVHVVHDDGQVAQVYGDVEVDGYVPLGHAPTHVYAYVLILVIDRYCIVGVAAHFVQLVDTLLHYTHALSHFIQAYPATV